MRLIALIVPLTLTLAGCPGTTPNGSTSADPSDGAATAADVRASDTAREYPLDTLPTTTVTIGGHTFRVWLARDFDPDRPDVVQEGLMHVLPSEIADDQGMLFVFYSERVRSFWMRNTVTPLDIAYARMNGEIVTIRQMQPLTLWGHSSIEPAMFALEVKQGTFDRLGIREGDTLVVPDEALVVGG